VLTAIGHERDVHVADMVAFDHLKTPTALADYFVDILAQEDLRVQTLAGRLSLAVRGKVGVQNTNIERLRERLRSAAMARLRDQRQRISLLEYRVGALNPASILAKGFSLTLKDGRRVTSAAQLKQGDDVTIVLSDGNVKGKIL
jgi:exodeoxyribonuclease VII large subunit